MAAFLPRRPSELQIGIWNWVLFPVILAFRGLSKVFALFFQRLDLYSDYDLRGYPKNYVAIVTRPVESDSTEIVKAHSINENHMNHVRLRRRIRLRSAR